MAGLFDAAGKLSPDLLLPCNDDAVAKLRLSEVAEVLTIDIDGRDRPSYHPDLQFQDIHDVLNVCSSLITTVDLPSNHQDTASSVADVYDRFAHFSVKEFLTSNAIQSSVCSRFAIVEDLAHLQLAKLCLAYLMRPVVRLCDDDITSLPFLTYAAK